MSLQNGDGVNTIIIIVVQNVFIGIVLLDIAKVTDKDHISSK